ncbi:MAG: chemotaxis protein CheX [Desulfobacterales bacterium]|nr:MAG: chemotaxis protein CheX [Desulfobacterales bacterium]
MNEQLDIGQEIIDGVKDVFSTMLMMDVVNEDVVYDAPIEIPSNLTSMIGLGDSIKGVLAVHCPKIVATSITGGFLGMDVEELDDDVRDAIGEIANMIAGNLKVSYAKAGSNIELAIPTSIVGDSFKISGMANAKRITVQLKIESGTFWVELMYIEN